jgi:hypothetical protein
VVLRARWVTLRARWVTLRARWVTLRARWVTTKRFRGGFGVMLQSLWAPPLPLESFPVLPIPQRLQYAQATDSHLLGWVWWRSGSPGVEAHDEGATVVARTRMYV